ncbi:hypothetical protein [Varibaculum cambriense]|uniref:hypothetical protein n=1 Tax=Varibaculum cambriense TaxID=184870 RepID=UPI0028FF53B3|nr:hypothetical protein [Varibaculum cambriense]MDU1225123.1 hypothetical protein [Varibaculum cambriense]
MSEPKRWIKISQDLPQHPKMLVVSIPARWLFAELLCYCSRFLTDGAITRESANALAMPIAMHTAMLKAFPKAMREAMPKAMLDFEEIADSLLDELCTNDPTKPSLTKTENGFKVTDYLDYQEAKKDVLARQEHGRKMARARWGKKNDASSNAVSNAQSNAVSNAPGNATSNALRNADKDKDIDIKEKIYKKENQPPAKTRKRAVPLPADWKPNPTHARIALERGIDLEAQAEKFRDYARAHGKTYRDWDAGFRNWLRSDYTKPENLSPRYRNQEDQIERVFQVAAASDLADQAATDSAEIFTLPAPTGGDAA